MISWRKWGFVGLLLLSLIEVAFAADRLPVFVSVEPQRYFVQQIGKALVAVQAMVRPGASPATYEPKARQMAQLSRAKIYFAIGVPFERVWLPKISAANPGMLIVHTDQGIEKLTMATHHHPDDLSAPPSAGEHHKPHRIDTEASQHHERGRHEHEEDHAAPGGDDPHIWLSPPLVKVQAAAIRNALQALDPAHHKVYEANYQEFLSRIDALDTKLKRTLEGKQGLRFMVFHPSWGYFAKAYGLEQIPIEIEGKAPKPAQLKAMIEHAREEHIQVIFVQPQFSTKSAALIAKAIGGQVAFADPLASDWKANLYEVANKFKAALR